MIIIELWVKRWKSVVFVDASRVQERSQVPMDIYTDYIGLAVSKKMGIKEPSHDDPILDFILSTKSVYS